jgi:hypothetical protein
MAKRRTIGENPLDAVISEHPWDAVVSDPLADPKMKGPQLQPEKQLGAELTPRLAALEAEINAVKGEVAQLRARVTALEAAGQAPSEPWWVTRLREKLGGK